MVCLKGMMVVVWKVVMGGLGGGDGGWGGVDGGDWEVVMMIRERVVVDGKVKVKVS